jgi:hypothetical protein
VVQYAYKTVSADNRFYIFLFLGSKKVMVQSTSVPPGESPAEISGHSEFQITRYDYQD